MSVPQLDFKAEQHGSKAKIVELGISYVLKITLDTNGHCCQYKY